MTPDGYEVGFHGEFHEIVPDERIVSTEVFEGAGGDENGTVEHRDVHGGRQYDAHRPGAGAGREVRDMIVDSGMEAGMQDAMDLLEEVAVSLG